MSGIAKRNIDNEDTQTYKYIYTHANKGQKKLFFLAWGIRLQSPALESQVLNQSSRTVNIQAIFISNQLMQFIFVIFMQNAKCFVKCTFISTFFIFYLCFLRDSFCNGNELCALDSYHNDFIKDFMAKTNMQNFRCNFRFHFLSCMLYLSTVEEFIHAALNFLLLKKYFSLNKKKVLDYLVNFNLINSFCIHQVFQTN